MVLEIDKNMNRIKLTECTNGTPATRIPELSSTLHNGYISHINGTPISDIQELKNKITAARQNKDTFACICFGTIHQHAMHPILGVPQLQHDQMNIISKHLSEMKEETKDQRATNGIDNITPIIHKLIWKNLKLADDWYKWKEVGCIQLDNYEKTRNICPPV